MSVLDVAISTPVGTNVSNTNEGGERVSAEAIYIAHTSYCTGWDLDSILDGTNWKKACRTWRVPPEPVQMLDWDFRRVSSLGFEKTWERHLELVRERDFEVVMSPDLFSLAEFDARLRQYETLEKFCDRVVMPVHVAPPVDGLELAWPVGVWTRDYVAVWEVQDEVTHLLGGSPHAQLEFARYFPNLRTVDGNQVFWCAVRFGKYWDDGRWVKPERPLPNEEIFRISIRNVTAAWRRWNER